MTATPDHPVNDRGRQRHVALYVQIIVGIVAGVAVGVASPHVAGDLKLLGDLFIKLVKMVITPVIFLTVSTGVAGMRDIGELQRVALKAFGYFLFFSTLALFIGLAMALFVQPGAGMHISINQLDAGSVAEYIVKAHAETVSSFFLDIVPTTLFSAFVEGNILQVLLVAVLTGIGIALTGETARPLRNVLEQLSAVVFKVVALVMRAAPIGAFGAMAFTIGKFGLVSLIHLASLVASFYLAALLFVLVVLGLVARINGFSLWLLLRYLRAELVLVLGTSSSEAALPNVMRKLELAGCDKTIVGLVVPAGYSFNLDGTNIYMTLTALFLAQACDVSLSAGQIALLLAVAMLSSKGAAGVTGAGFITLAATLTIMPDIPPASMALVLGVDRFMSLCRSLTNFVGNAVATIVIARWEKALDAPTLSAALRRDVIVNAPQLAPAAR